MSALVDFVLSHTERNACRCGKCFDSGVDKVLHHTVNMYFFDVCTKDNPNVDEFKRLTKEHKGEFRDLNVLDDNEHSYMDIGSWIGDQGIGMQYMALGKILGLWKILHPGLILDLKDPAQKELADKMAGMGMVSIMPHTSTQ